MLYFQSSVLGGRRGGEAGVSGDHWTMPGELGINTRWVMVLLGASKTVLEGVSEGENELGQ